MTLLLSFAWSPWLGCTGVGLGKHAFSRVTNPAEDLALQKYSHRARGAWGGSEAVLALLWRVFSELRPAQVDQPFYCSSGLALLLESTSN